MADLPNQVEKRDTTQEGGRRNYLAIVTEPSSNKVILLALDATNAQMLIKQVDNTGADVSAFGSISAKIADTEGSDSTFHPCLFQECKVHDSSGNKKRSMIFCSDPFADSMTTPVLDLTGGGGATIGAYTIVSMHGDYYVCAPVGGGSNVNVAKPTKLRNSITSETFDGDTFSYDYSNSGTYVAALGDQNAQYVNRLATWNSGANNEHQDITPRYLSGDTIYAITVSGGTGVTVSSVAVTLLDINVDGRAWTAATY